MNKPNIMGIPDYYLNLESEVARLRGVLEQKDREIAKLRENVGHWHDALMLAQEERVKEHF